MKRPIIIHPFLFVIYSVLFLFSHNINRILLTDKIVAEILIIMLTLNLLAFLFWLLLIFMVKDKLKAGLIVSLFLFLFFSYGHFYDVMEGLMIAGFNIGRHRYLISLWTLLFASGTHFLMKVDRGLDNLTKILNITTAILVIIPFINIGCTFRARTTWQNRMVRTSINNRPSPARTDERLPDIYYIILDRYASGDILNEVYNFDNSQFIGYLTERGFYVASKSRSNYLISDHSLASSLNMEYINHLTEKVGEDSDDWMPLYLMLQDYRVWRFLKSRGYRFIHFGSWWNPTSTNRYADANYLKYLPDDFLVVLYKTTFLYPIAVKLGILDPRLMQAKRLLCKFNALAEIPDIEEPTFVFAHMIIPHVPYIFDRNGNFLSQQQISKRSRAQNYLGQLIFANQKVRVLIDKLLSSSEPPPVIILQADEGSCPSYERDELNFNWKKASRAELREKTAILNAYYLPDVDKGVLYPSITPVNSFRVIFNLYFNADFELLPDETYALADKKHPYQLFKVTDKIR